MVEQQWKEFLGIFHPKEEETYFGEDEATMADKGSQGQYKVEDTSSILELQEGQGEEVIAGVITKEKVLGMLKCLKVDKSPSPDGLHPRVLKEIAEKIVETLVVIFQESLESWRAFILQISQLLPENKKDCDEIGYGHVGQKKRIATYGRSELGKCSKVERVYENSWKK
eukprot:g29791.t1